MKEIFKRHAKITIVSASFIASVFQVSYGTSYLDEIQSSACSTGEEADCSQTQFSASGFDFAPMGSKVLSVRSNQLLNTIYNKKPAGGGAGDLFSSEKLGFFLSGQTVNTDRKRTRKENGFDAESAEFIAGADFRFNEQFILGLAIGYGDNENDYDKSSGNIDTESVSTTLYSIFTPIDNVVINSYVGWSGMDIEGRRSITGTNSFTRMTTEGDKLVAGISALYDFHLDGFSISPEVAIDYSDTWIQGFTEKGDPTATLVVGDQAIHSFISKVGFNASYAWSQPWGVIVPHFRFFHLHEYGNDHRTVHVSFSSTPNGAGFVTDNPDRDYYTLAAGVSTVLPHGLQLYIDYEKTIEHDFINSFTINGGVRFSF